MLAILDRRRGRRGVTRVGAFCSVAGLAIVLLPLSMLRPVNTKQESDTAGRPYGGTVIEKPAETSTDAKVADAGNATEENPSATDSKSEENGNTPMQPAFGAGGMGISGSGTGFVGGYPPAPAPPRPAQPERAP